MTQQDKELLIKDLCARLPYGVKVHINFPREKVYTLSSIQKDTFTEEFKCGFKEYPQSTCIDERIQPYLFPISSMTEEQFNNLADSVNIFGESNLNTCLECIDYLNVHHFDYQGLIDKGLAIDATNLNIY